MSAPRGWLCSSALVVAALATLTGGARAQDVDTRLQDLGGLGSEGSPAPGSYLDGTVTNLGFRLTLDLDESAYVALLDVGPDGDVRLLFPQARGAGSRAFYGAPRETSHFDAGFGGVVPAGRYQLSYPLAGTVTRSAGFGRLSASSAPLYGGYLVLVTSDLPLALEDFQIGFARRVSLVHLFGAEGLRLLDSPDELFTALVDTITPNRARSRWEASFFSYGLSTDPRRVGFGHGGGLAYDPYGLGLESGFGSGFDRFGFGFDPFGFGFDPFGFGFDPFGFGFGHSFGFHDFGHGFGTCPLFGFGGICFSGLFPGFGSGPFGHGHDLHDQHAHDRHAHDHHAHDHHAHDHHGAGTAQGHTGSSTASGDKGASGGGAGDASGGASRRPEPLTRNLPIRRAAGTGAVRSTAATISSSGAEAQRIAAEARIRSRPEALRPLPMGVRPAGARLITGFRSGQKSRLPGATRLGHGRAEPLAIVGARGRGSLEPGPMRRGARDRRTLDRGALGPGTLGPGTLERDTRGRGAFGHGTRERVPPRAESRGSRVRRRAPATVVKHARRVEPRSTRIKSRGGVTFRRMISRSSADRRRGSRTASRRPLARMRPMANRSRARSGKASSRARAPSVTVRRSSARRGARGRSRKSIQ